VGEALAAEVRFSTVISVPVQAWKSVPQGLKPSLLWLFTARLKPCPSFKSSAPPSVCGAALKPSLLWLFTARLKPCPSFKSSAPPPEFAVQLFEAGDNLLLQWVPPIADYPAAIHHHVAQQLRPKTPRLKPEERSPTRTARLESRAPLHECGGSHQPTWTSLTLSRLFGTQFGEGGSYAGSGILFSVGEAFSQAVQAFVKFDIFGSFWGLAAQRGWTKGFFIGKPTPKSGTEANRGT
jgi:hypothetical protein